MKVKKNSATAENTPLSVLVVDDEMLIRWSISEALMATGHNVVEADSARGALEALASTRQPIDVVLLDYRLPDSNGLGLLATIRQTLPESAVVLMTAYGTPEVTRDALGVHDLSTRHVRRHEAGERSGDDAAVDGDRLERWHALSGE